MPVPFRPLCAPVPLHVHTAAIPSAHALPPSSCPPPPLLASAHPPSCRHTLVLSTDGVGMNHTAVREHHIDLKALDRIIAAGDASRINAAALEAQRRPNPALQPVRGAAPAPGNLLERAARPPHPRVQVDTPDLLRAALSPAGPAALAAVPRGGRVLARSRLGSVRSSVFLSVFVVVYQALLSCFYLPKTIAYVVAWAVEVLANVGRASGVRDGRQRKASRASPATFRLPPTVFLLITVRASDHTNLAHRTAANPMYLDLLSLQQFVPHCGSDARRSRSSQEGGRRRWIGYWQSSRPIVPAARSLLNRRTITYFGRLELSLALEGHAEAAEWEEAKPVGLGAGRRFRCPPPTSTRYALPNPNSVSYSAYFTTYLLFLHCTLLRARALFSPTTYLPSTVTQPSPPLARTLDHPSPPLPRDPAEHSGAGRRAAHFTLMHPSRNSFFLRSLPEELGRHSTSVLRALNPFSVNFLFYLFFRGLSHLGHSLKNAGLPEVRPSNPPIGAVITSITQALPELLASSTQWHQYDFIFYVRPSIPQSGEFCPHPTPLPSGTFRGERARTSRFGLRGTNRLDSMPTPSALGDLMHPGLLPAHKRAAHHLQRGDRWLPVILGSVEKQNHSHRNACQVELLWTNGNYLRAGQGVMRGRGLTGTHGATSECRRPDAERVRDKSLKLVFDNLPYVIFHRLLFQPPAKQVQTMTIVLVEDIELAAFEAAEQPTNAALVSLGPNPVAFELMQVRVGPQRAPALRGGMQITGTVDDATEEFKATFAAARGPMGALLIANASKLARNLREARAGEVSDELV
ncbi:hypothetical protein B0H14DRAFT_3140785 [Mycena olivaceomarginata]|nr:hypothetical protein B0H14DRAFT_3140785 [Mycena olivaceomarginata]